MDRRDVHEEQLRDTLYRDWVKSGLALKYFKEGIEGFIDDQVQEQQSSILNEIRRQTSRPDASCDKCQVHEILPHHKRISCRFGKRCACRDSGRRPCPNDVCGRIFDNILEQHRHGCPSFKNTDATKWCSDHWEIAKCFLDKAGYAEKLSASDTDCNGLLSIITNNMFVQLSLDTPIDNEDVFSKSKSARNEILHQANLQISEAQLNVYIDTMIKALEDKGKLKEDKCAETAVQKLMQLRDRKLSVSTSDQYEVRFEAMKAIEEKRQEVLDVIEKKGQDAVDAIEEKAEFERLSTQYDNLKESLNNLMSSTASNIQCLYSRQDDLEEKLDGLKGTQEEFGRKLTDIELSEKIQKLKALVLEHRKEFKTDLMAFYRQNHGTLPLAPLVEKHDAPILDFYVKPSFTPKDEASERFHTYRRIFFEGRRQCRNIYLTSPAGMGKTSFVKHLVMTWCHAHEPERSHDKHFEEYKDDVELMKSFEFIFLLSLRDVPETDCDVDAMIRNQILVDLANYHCYDDDNFLKEILAKERCLIVLDGLDEWSHPVTKPVACRCGREKSIPHRQVRENCSFLTTMRPWKLTRANLSDASIDKHIELKELSDSSFSKLIYEATCLLNAKCHSKKSPEDFTSEIQEKDFGNLERIPLILMQLLCLWFDGKHLGSSRCSIFADMIELLFSRGEIKGIENEEKYCLSGATSDILPKCFYGNFCCSENSLLLHALGAMSFDALFSEKESPVLLFDNLFLSRYLSPEQQLYCLETGILTQNKQSTSVSARRSKAWFIHKTYQEFLAALHISLSKEAAGTLTEQLFSLLSSVEDILDMSLFFTFLYGLCPDDICTGISHRIQSIAEHDQYLQIQRKSLLSYCPLYRTRNRAVILPFIFFMTECAVERKDNCLDMLIIPLEDIIIEKNDRCMSIMCELVKLKGHCMKTMFWVTQEFLDSVDICKIRSVQNLLISEADGECVRKLVSNSRGTLHAIEMPASCLSVTFDILKKIKHLQALHLHTATLAHNDLLLLYSWISKSTRFEQIVLENLKCSDHGSSESTSCCKLVLDLSAHENLNCLVFESLVVCELMIPPAVLKYRCSWTYLKQDHSVSIGSLKPASNLVYVLLSGVNPCDAESILQLAFIHSNMKRLYIYGLNYHIYIDITFSTISDSSLCGLIDDISRLELRIPSAVWDFASEEGEISLPTVDKYVSGIRGIDRARSFYYPRRGHIISLVQSSV